MNDAMQRMLPATLLALTLHGALLSWRMQLPETVQPKPLARKRSVSLKRLPPPPPLKKIVQETPALPQIAPAEHQPVRPLELQPGKKIAAAPPPLLPKIAQVKHQAIRPLELKPGKRVAAA
ncbi:MAG: hypothetical protein D3909_07540, partial [Candidatus Electrothrix sp. ATG1]|nr:hypothetical protein [Candidatus Electrothrix sp. ATG1]